MGTTIAPPVPQAPAASTPAPGTPAAAPPAGTPAASAPAAPRPAAPAPEGVSTNEIIGAMLKAAKNTSDLIFSPGKAPQVEVNGQLLQVQIPRVGTLSAQATARITAIVRLNDDGRRLPVTGDDIRISSPGGEGYVGPVLLLCVAARLRPAGDPALHEPLDYACPQRRRTPGRRRAGCRAPRLRRAVLSPGRQARLAAQLEYSAAY